MTRKDIEIIAAAGLMLFPDSGHGAHFQFAEEFAEAAAGFLAAA